MPNSKDASLSTSVENYLKAIWLIAREGTASTTAVAEHLGVSAPSVSAMLSKLQVLGFVEYERYRGVQLTASGTRRVLLLLRGHRLIETFLLEHLGYSWDEVHEEAEKLEHAVSERFTERLAELLGHPSHDPHGDPIPRSDGTLPDTPNTPLAEVGVGQTFEVSRLMTQAADALHYLAELGVQPGAQLRVVKREPFGGLVHIRYDGREEVLSKELAMLIRGEVRR